MCSSQTYLQDPVARLHQEPPLPQSMQREAVPQTPTLAPQPPQLQTPSPPPLIAPLEEAPSTSTAQPPLLRNAFTALGAAASRGAGPPPYLLTRLAATQFLLDCMANGGALPNSLDSQRRSDGRVVLDALKAMLSSTEKAVLIGKPRAEGHAVSIAQHVTSLMLDLMEETYTSIGAKVPLGLRLGSMSEGHTSQVPPPPK